jgi:RNA polymerase sigma-70 factor, ECF subfamily
VTVTASATRIERLIRATAPDLLRYFERRVLPVDDAADLVSETLLVLFRRADALPSDDAAARMWMFGVARKVLAGHRRGSVRRAALADRLRDELAARPPRDDDAGTLAETLAERDALARALAALPDLDREIVALAAWDGFTLADIARHLHLREGTVRSRYSRARARLRSALTGGTLPA